MNYSHQELARRRRFVFRTTKIPDLVFYSDDQHHDEPMYVSRPTGWRTDQRLHSRLLDADGRPPWPRELGSKSLN